MYIAVNCIWTNLAHVFSFDPIACVTACPDELRPNVGMKFLTLNSSQFKSYSITRSAQFISNQRFLCNSLQPTISICNELFKRYGLLSDSVIDCLSILSNCNEFWLCTILIMISCRVFFFGWRVVYDFDWREVFGCILFHFCFWVDLRNYVEYIGYDFMAILCFFYLFSMY